MKISVRIKDIDGIVNRLHKTADGILQSSDKCIEVMAKDLAYSIQGEVRSSIKLQNESTKKLENSIQAEKLGFAEWGVANTLLMPIYWAIQEFGGWVKVNSALFLTFFRYGSWHKKKQVFIQPKSYLLKGFLKWYQGMVDLRLREFFDLSKFQYRG